jgi:SAM-dependent methyltransferase
MVRQADIFLESEGNAWFDRNWRQVGQRDPVSDLIGEIGLIPTNVLEIGSANGWRLRTLRERYACKILGVEPSLKAGTEAHRLGIPTLRTTADTLPGPADNAFDMVIYGFCLYVTDPEDWFRIAFEGDRVLKEGGHLVIHDFFEGRNLFAREYEHRKGLLSYHFDFAQLWLAHPWYCLVSRRIINADEMVVILKKKPATEVQP